MTSRFKDLSEWYLKRTEKFSIELSVLESLDEFQPNPGSSFAAEIVTIYLAIAPKIVESMRVSLESGDIMATSRAAHSLKSSSANVGALQLTEFCKAMEIQAGAGNQISILNVLFGELENEFQAVKQDLMLFSQANDLVC